MMRMTDIDGWVAFVGAGPGDDGLLTLRGARLLEDAGLVIADTGTADRLPSLIRAGVTGTEPATDAAGTAGQLAAAARAGTFTVRLFPGDPLLSGAAAEIRACAEAGVRFEIVPR